VDNWRHGRVDDLEYFCRCTLLLMSGVGRVEARDVIRPAVDRILASWT
jgi:hypothetical protein